MRRLAFQIYLTVVGVLLLFAVLASVVWVVHPKAPWERDLEAALGATAADLLPGPDRGPEELQAALNRLSSRLRVDTAVYGAEGGRLAAAGDSLPDTRPARYRSWLRHRGRATIVTLPLPDGRTFVARHTHPPGGRPRSSSSWASSRWPWRSGPGPSCAASLVGSSACDSAWRTWAVAI